MKKNTIYILTFLFFFSVLLVIPGLVEDDWQRTVNKMSSMINFIENNYYQDINPEDLAFSSIKGMLQTLDPHSYFLDPRRLTVMREEYKGKYSGLGIMIQKHDTRLVVISPIEGTPAYRLGLRPGDVISHISGKSTKDITSFDAMLLLRGKKGTDVEVTIVRKGLEKALDLVITRAEIPLYSVPYAFMLTEDIGYIFIRNFAKTTTREFEDKMELLEKKGMKKLILDVRGNAGGTFAESVSLSDEFLEEGKAIVSIRGRDSYYYKDFLAKKNKQFENIPLVILINQGTASAPEIVSGAIRDNDRGLIVGEDSYGKGLVQTVFPLASNAAIALTTAKYYTPSGVSIQRDYSHVEDYYLYRPQTADAARDVRFTTGGRKVLGQGGISPDYEVKFKFKPQTFELLLNGAFFNYGKKFVGRETRVTDNFIFPEEIQSGNLSTKGKIIIDRNFSVNKTIIEDFKSFLKSEKINIEPKRFEEARADIKRELERELHSQFWNIEEGNRIYRLSDPVVLKAIEVMTEAQSLIKK